MAGTIETGSQERASRLTLNSDGRSHPLINAACVFTLIIGFVAFALGLFIRASPGSGLGMAIVSSVAGLLAILVGLFTQMMSATREQRIVLVVGIIAGFIGCALGLAHGGFG